MVNHVQLSLAFVLIIARALSINNSTKESEPKPNPMAPWLVGLIVLIVFIVFLAIFIPAYLWWYRKKMMRSGSFDDDKPIENKVKFTSRDQLILIVYFVLLLGLLFSGAYGFSKLSVEKSNETGCTLPSTSNVCLIFTSSKSDYVKCKLDEVHQFVNCTRKDATTTFSDATLYFFSLMLTIGYGNVAIDGILAQMIIIIFGMLSIPLFFATMRHFVDMVDVQFLTLYYSFINRSKWLGNILAKSRNVVIFILKLAIIGSYLLSMAAIFYFSHQFDSFETAFYFVFQSSTMSGLLELPKNYYAHLFATFPLIYGIFGTSSLSSIPQQWTLTFIEKFVDLICSNNKDFSSASAKSKTKK